MALLSITITWSSSFLIVFLNSKSISRKSIQLFHRISYNFTSQSLFKNQHIFCQSCKTSSNLILNLSHGNIRILFVLLLISNATSSCTQIENFFFKIVSFLKAIYLFKASSFSQYFHFLINLFLISSSNLFQQKLSSIFFFKNLICIIRGFFINYIWLLIRHMNLSSRKIPNLVIGFYTFF